MTKTFNTDPVLILGGRSDIGLACAHAFAALGHPIQLAARNAASLQGAVDDIILRYNVACTAHEFDVLATSDHEAFLDALPAAPEVVISVIGFMGEQEQSETDFIAAGAVMRSNFEGPAHILGACANRMEKAGHGTLVGVSSVAGDRGRASNYVYGSAKAGFTAFLSGLRNRLAKTGVHVVTVKPGFVATQMTAGLDLPEKLTAEPSEVAHAILRAVQRGHNIIYTRKIWRVIMAIIRNIPEAVFKKLSL
ncbi:SDR family oxidoreductase [Albirhodobacter sp. R86504]|uniref:SDR family oxidoreductase n=1 Tax=Albirhodobacter sp. R86504 TaxID=3093848 RepID=UPI00366EE7A6